MFASGRADAARAGSRKKINEKKPEHTGLNVSRCMLSGFPAEGIATAVQPQLVPGQTVFRQRSSAHVVDLADLEQVVDLQTVVRPQQNPLAVPELAVVAQAQAVAAR